MRVLWFAAQSGGYSPQIGQKGKRYCGSGWVSSLMNEMRRYDDIELGVCFIKDGEEWKFEADGVSYYTVPNHKKPIKEKVLDFVYLNDESRDEILWPHYLNAFSIVIDDFEPDVIEIFGSEIYLSLSAIAAKGRVPTVLHIQGLLSLYTHIYLPPGISKYQFITSQGCKKIYSNIQLLAYWNRSCYREKKILESVPYVIGRTEWDRQACEILAPQAEYHWGGEILKDSFYDDSERIIPDVPVIATTISSAIYKGYDFVLKVANILKNEMNVNFVWNVYGNVDCSFIEKHLDLSHKKLNINLCGTTKPDVIKENLLHSTVYVHPSYIENSPNSVCEAQILGIPVVLSNVGGNSSLVKHDSNGFLYPATDPYIAAYYIAKLIKDDKLNVLMGEDGKIVASKRHNKTMIAEKLLDLYKIMIKKELK